MAPEDLRHIVDIEADLDDQHISQVRFGRSRFLRTAGLALFGLAAGLVAEPQEAEAHRQTPEGCYGEPACGHCRGCTCTSPGCKRPRNTCNGPNLTQHGTCWRTMYDGSMIKCCDWRKSTGKLCICKCRA